MKPDKMIYRINPEWVVLNFLRIFETHIADFRHPRYSDKKQTARIIEKANLVTMKDLSIQRFSTRKMDVNPSKSSEEAKLDLKL